MSLSKAIPFPKGNWIRARPNLTTLSEHINKFMSSRKSDIDTARYNNAVDVVASVLQLPAIRPFHINDVLKYYTKLNTSPGYPWINRGYTKKGDLSVQEMKLQIHGLKYWDWKMSAKCRLVQKSCLALGKEKTRLIWSYPAHYTFAEQMFCMPLINHFKTHKTYYALWYDPIRKRIPNFGSTTLSLDFTAFDTTIPAFLIYSAFDILYRRIQFECYNEWGNATDPECLRNLWHKIVHYFIYTPNDRGMNKFRGIPSGSSFTNMIGSICNMIMAYYVLKNINGVFYGDDCCINVDHADLQKISLDYFNAFGVDVNPDKSVVSRVPRFLGRQWINRLPRTDTDKLIASWKFPKKRTDLRELGYCLAASAYWLNEEFNSLVLSLCGDPPANGKPRDRELRNMLEYAGLESYGGKDRIRFALL